MDTVMTETVPVTGRRCGLEEVFARPFIELIGLAPRNPVVRGLILAQTGKMPGPERVTFDQIKEWVETTCAPRVGGGHQTKVPAADGISVTVEFSETENGRAYYSVDRSGSAEFALDADELVEMVQEAIEANAGLDGVIETIAGRINDNAWDRCEPDLNNYGEYEYDEHNSGDSSNANTEFSRTQIRERLREFLREQHPQLLEELV